MELGEGSVQMLCICCCYTARGMWSAMDHLQVPTKNENKSLLNWEASWFIFKVSFVL